MHTIDSPQSEITKAPKSADVARALAQALKEKFNSHFFATSNGVAGPGAQHTVYVKGKHPLTVINTVKSFAKDYLNKVALPSCLLLIIATVFAGCAPLAPQRPHVYLGVQNVSQLDRVQDSRWPDSGSAYVNVLVPFGERLNFQISPIVPFNTQHEPLLRLAVEAKVF